MSSVCFGKWRVRVAQWNGQYNAFQNSRSRSGGGYTLLLLLHDLKFSMNVAGYMEERVSWQKVEGKVRANRTRVK